MSNCQSLFMAISIIQITIQEVAYTHSDNQFKNLFLKKMKKRKGNTSREKHFAIKFNMNSI